MITPTLLNHVWCAAQFAEDCGLIVSIGNWVLREACRQTRAWADAGLPLATIAVNISAIEFRNEHFLDGVFAILQDTGLSPRRLELELTETVLMKRADSTESVFKKLPRAACSWRSTTLAPVTPVSAISGNSLLIRSKSISPSSDRSPPIRMTPPSLPP
jgi:hypothetical protein